MAFTKQGITTMQNILNVLEEAGKEGIWLREMARKLGMYPSHLFYYLKKPEFLEQIDIVKNYQGTKRAFLVLLRLRKFTPK